LSELKLANRTLAIPAAGAVKSSVVPIKDVEVPVTSPPVKTEYDNPAVMFSLPDISGVPVAVNANANRR